MHGSEQKIYYKMLLPQDIQPILKNAVFNQAEKTAVEFITFPTEPDEIQKILHLFVNNRCDDNMIRKFSDFDPSLVTGFDISTNEDFDLNDNASIAKAINSPTTYMYAKPKNLNDVHIPLEKTRDFVVFVGDSRMIDENIWATNLSNGNNNVTIHIGSNTAFEERSIKILFNKTTGQMNFNIKFKGTLSQQIKDINWVLECEASKKSIPLPAEKKIDFEEYKNSLIRLKDGLSKCGITEDIDISKLTDKERRELDFICRAVSYSQIDNEPEKNILFGRFSFSKYKILLYKRTSVDDNSKFDWVNPFVENQKLSIALSNEADDFEPENGAITSVFMIAQRGEYAKYVNTNYNTVYEFLTSTEINDAVLELLLKVQCHMISAFDDDNTNSEVLELALKFGKWISENTDLDKDYIYINMLQIFKRQGKQLSSSDYLKLLGLIKSDNYELRFASFTLLEELDNAIYSFNHLIPAVQEFYKNSPIYALFTELGQQKQSVSV
jgi:hypothetical protein